MGDGRGRFFHVVLPMISPVILFNVIIGVINAAQVFAVPLIMTGGGPERSTYFHSMYVYDQAFAELEISYACTIGLALFLIVLMLSLVRYRFAGDRGLT